MWWIAAVSPAGRQYQLNDSGGHPSAMAIYSKGEQCHAVS